MRSFHKLVLFLALVLAVSGTASAQKNDPKKRPPKGDPPAVNPAPSKPPPQKSRDGKKHGGGDYESLFLREDRDGNKA